MKLFKWRVKKWICRNIGHPVAMEGEYLVCQRCRGFRKCV